jgi:Zn-dependent peptidase ImmA (M78 family)
MTMLLESAGAVVIRFDFGTPLVSGVTMYEPRDGLPPIIFVSSTLAAEKARFILGRELAHAALHYHLPLPPAEADEEANAFASEFLMPSAEIRGYLTRVKLETVLELKSHWKVPGTAIVQRAATLGRISERQKQYLMAQMSHLGRQDPKLTPIEEPTLLSEIVHFHTSRLEYSDDDLADALGLLDVSEFREIYRPNVGGILRLVR